MVWVRPTRFGNVLSAIDDYTERRYGIDTKTLWVRLLGVLPDLAREDVRQARDTVSALVNIVCALGIVTLLVLCLEIAEILHTIGRPLSWDVEVMVLLLVAALGSYTSYRSSVMSLATLGDTMARWIDLRRLHLIRAVGSHQPPTVKAEFILFKHLLRSTLMLGRLITVARSLFQRLPKIND